MSRHDTAVLRYLADAKTEPMMNGVQIIEALQKALPDANIRRGAVYAALWRLEEAGLVIAHKAHSSRYYELTKAGREEAARSAR